MFHALRLIFLLCGLTSLTACATVSKGTHERVMFETTPPGATITTDIETTASKSARRKDDSVPREFFSCSPTPCEIKLSRRTNTIATVTYPGMEPLEFALTSGTSARNLAPNVTGGIATGVSTAALGAAIGSSFGATAVGLSAVAGPAAIIAVGVGGSMALVDVASGAGLQISPNPLTVKMVPKGTKVIPDPEVEALRVKRARARKTPKTAKEICARPAGYNTPKQRAYCTDYNARSAEEQREP